MIDVALVTEPWVSHIRNTTTLTHPGYDHFTPASIWNTQEENRPRVITYVRIGAQLHTETRVPVHHRDLLWIDVNGFTILNYYRAPGEDHTLEYLEGLQPPQNFIAAGDANVRSPAFEPGSANLHGGRRLANWAAESGCAFIGQLGKPTHRDGHVIDLPFSNIPFAESDIAEDLGSGSDHLPLRIVLPGRGREPREERIRGWRVTPRDQDRLKDLAMLGARNLPQQEQSPEGIESAAAALSSMLQDCVHTIGRPRRRDGRTAPWWTDEVRQARKNWRRSEDRAKDSELRREYLRAIRSAKRSYWRRQTDEITSDKDLYRIVGWYKSGQRIRSVPIIDGEKAIENSYEKAEFLTKSILFRFDPDDDIPQIPCGSEGTLPWSTTVTLEEAERFTCGVSSTSPGTDMLTVYHLKILWPAIGEYLRSLIEKCLKLGYFPQVWRQAEVVMMPKVGKTDFSSYRSWRPIALLSCLGKGLERIVARRMVWTALQSGLISPHHAGAVPKRSAMDLAASLTHDVELALSKGLKVTMVTLDVQGAFDALLKNRLLERMVAQGWPEATIKLTNSFLTDRRIATRLEDTTTKPVAALCGTPQGSPWSPMLYMLYLCELISQSDNRWGYADDVAVLGIGQDLQASTRAAQREVNSILKYGRENKISFAPEKMEAIHFTRNRNRQNPKIKLLDGLIIEPVALPSPAAGNTDAPPALRWLGVYFDRKLKFRRHVEVRAAMAAKVANHLKGLAAVTRGPPADGLYKAVRTVVLPTLLYGSEAWYKGRKKPSSRHRNAKVSSRLGAHVALASRALHTAVRATVPAYRTHPRDALYVISGIPTAEIALEEARYRFALRLQTVNGTHPLATRAATQVIQRGKAAGQPYTLHTNIQQSARILPSIRRPVLYAPRYEPGSRRHPTGNRTKEKAAEEFKAWFERQGPFDITVFTDGSKSKEGLGYGYAIYEGQEVVGTGQGKMSPDGVVFDAEGLGALRGLQKATEMYSNLPITLCVDNTATIWSSQKDAPNTSQWVFIAIHEIMDKYEVSVRWSPGHMGIDGNELADKHADLAVKKGPLDPESTPTAAGIKAKAREAVRSITRAWKADRQKTLPIAYTAFRIPYNPGTCPIALKLPRRVLGWYVSALSTHGDYQWYHKKLRHADAELHCICSSVSRGLYFKSPEHMIHCEVARSTSGSWPRPTVSTESPTGKPWGEGTWAYRMTNMDFTQESDRNVYSEWLMANPTAFQLWCEATGYFSRISPAFEPQRECCEGWLERQESEERQRELEYESSDEELEVVIPNALPRI